MMRKVVLSVAVLGLLAPQDASAKTYTDSYYGFRLEIPSGLHRCRHTGYSNHGFRLVFGSGRCSRPNEGEFLSLYVAFHVNEAPLPTVIHEFCEGSGSAPARGPTGLTWHQCAMQSDGAHHRHRHVTFSGEPEDTPVIIAVELRCTPGRCPHYLPLLANMIASLRFL